MRTASRSRPILAIPTPQKSEGLPSLIDVEYGKIISCIFRDVDLEVKAKELVDSTFEHCKKIQCGCTDDEAEIINCNFNECYDLEIEDGTIQNSIFTHLGSLYIIRSTVENCKFTHIFCDKSGFVSAEDSTISHSSFDDISLQGDAYLCDGVGNTLIEHCHFENLHTDRSTTELFRGEKVTGILRKKSKAYNIIDLSTCTGLTQQNTFEE